MLIQTPTQLLLILIPLMVGFHLFFVCLIFSCNFSVFLYYFKFSPSIMHFCPLSGISTPPLRYVSKMVEFSSLLVSHLLLSLFCWFSSTLLCFTFLPFLPYLSLTYVFLFFVFIYFHFFWVLFVFFCFYFVYIQNVASVALLYLIEIGSLFF